MALTSASYSGVPLPATTSEKSSLLSASDSAASASTSRPFLVSSLERKRTIFRPWRLGYCCWTETRSSIPEGGGASAPSGMTRPIGDERSRLADSSSASDVKWRADAPPRSRLPSVLRYSHFLARLAVEARGPSYRFDRAAGPREPVVRTRYGTPSRRHQNAATVVGQRNTECMCTTSDRRTRSRSARPIGAEKWYHRGRCIGKYQTSTPSVGTGWFSGTSSSPGPSTLVVATVTSWPRRASSRVSPAAATIGPP